MMRYITLVSTVLACSAASCSDDAQPAAGTDTDSDSDTDSDLDSDVHDYWDWESLAIPSPFLGHGVGYRLFASGADDATICVGNGTTGTGGILSFDGSSLTAEADGFVCEYVYGWGAENVWAVGYVDQTFEPVLYGRSGGVWSLETVEGADDSCGFEAVFGASVDDAAVVGWCSGERLSWVRDGVGGWIAGAAIVPTNLQVDWMIGVHSMPGADVFYGTGVFESAGATDLGYAAEYAFWVGGEALDALYALDGVGLMANDGTGWSESVSCPYDLSYDEYSICWSRGARDGASGDLYLGGGRGGSGNENVDDWRLNRIAGGVVYGILEPCGGAAPRCGVSDLSLSPDGVLFAVANSSQPVLLWHAIPTEG